MKTKYFLLAILLFALHGSAFSYNGTQEIDDICYNLITKSKKATVTSNKNKYYEGDVVIPSTVTYEGTVCNVVGIEDRAFNNCKDLSSVTIPASVLTIGSYAFYGCKSLMRVTFEGDGLTSMGELAFCGCGSITNLSLPNTLANIPEGAFLQCVSLKNINFPNSLVTIGERAFQECASLTSVVIPETVTALGEAVFSGCTNLTSFRLPKNIKEIPEGAFSECVALNHVVIPEGVEIIGEDAFESCAGITELYLPCSLTEIDGSFSGLESLQLIDIADLKSWSQLFFSDYTFNPISWARKASVNGEKIEKIVIPDGVTEINESSFTLCKDVTSITIPNSVTKIRSSAFYYCPKLTTVTIGKGIKKINGNAFGRCGEITDVFCYAEKIPEADYAFKDSYIEEAVLHVPSSAVNAYKNDYYWGKFGTIIPITDSDPKANLPICAKPLISYRNGEIVFSCDTPGVTFQSMILDSDIGKHLGDEINISGSYVVKVMATREGYASSDVSIAEINWFETGSGQDTEIEVIDLKNAKTIDAGSSAIYNLAGQKVSAGYKGVVIINGKKILVK